MIPEIIHVRVLTDAYLEITAKFDNTLHYIKSRIDYDNMEIHLGQPSQSDWQITTNIPELKLLCKYLHYRHMIMAQEVSDYIDDHFEERILDQETCDKIRNAAQTWKPISAP